MTTQRIEIHKCDLCGTEIPANEYSPIGGAMLYLNHKSEKLTLSDGEEVDICKPCCIILSKAKNIGLITIDLSSALERLGFTKKGNDLWEKKG
jgi:hypothetical protein